MPRPRPNVNNNLPGTPPVWLPLGGRLFRRGMRSPRPTSQFYRNLSSRVPILSMCARGAHSVFIIYYLLSIIYFAPQGHSRPRWCTDPQHPGKLQQKNSLTFSVRLYFGALCLGLSRGLTKPHWGFVVGRYARRPTRPVLVPDGAPVRNILGNRNKKTPRNFLRGVYFGAPSGTRTQDPLIKSQLLSLVAHTHGVCRCNKKHFSNDQNH